MFGSQTRRRLPVGGWHRPLLGHRAGAIRRAQGPDGRGAPRRTAAHPRHGAADDRRQRRGFCRPRRQRHRRRHHRAAVAAPRRRHRQRRRMRKRISTATCPTNSRDCAPRSSPGRRQSVARRFRLVRQSGDAGAEQALPGRPRRLRRASGVSAPMPSGCAPRPNSSTPNFCRRSKCWRPATATKIAAIR